MKLKRLLAVFMALMLVFSTTGGALAANKTSAKDAKTKPTLKITVPKEGIETGTYGEITINASVPGFITINLLDSNGTSVLKIAENAEIHSKDNEYEVMAFSDLGYALEAGTYTISATMVSQYGTESKETTKDLKITAPAADATATPTPIPGTTGNTAVAQNGTAAGAAYNPYGTTATGTTGAYSPYGTTATGTTGAYNPYGTTTSGTTGAYNPYGTTTSGTTSTYNPYGTTTSSTTSAYNPYGTTTSGSTTGSTYNPYGTTTTGTTNAYGTTTSGTTSSSGSYDPYAYNSSSTGTTTSGTYNPYGTTTSGTTTSSSSYDPYAYNSSSTGTTTTGSTSSTYNPYGTTSTGTTTSSTSTYYGTTTTSGTSAYDPYGTSSTTGTSTSTYNPYGTTSTSGTSTYDPYGTSTTTGSSTSTYNPYGTSTTTGSTTSTYNPYGTTSTSGTSTYNPYGTSTTTGSTTSTYNPYGTTSTSGTSTYDPYGTSSTTGSSTYNPYGTTSASGTSTYDPYGTSTTTGSSTYNPYGTTSTSGTSTYDPYGTSTGTTSTYNPYGTTSTSGTSTYNPYGTTSSTYDPYGIGGTSTSTYDPYGIGGTSTYDPYGIGGTTTYDPYSMGGTTAYDPYATQYDPTQQAATATAAVPTVVTYRSSGGFLSIGEEGYQIGVGVSDVYPQTETSFWNLPANPSDADIWAALTRPITYVNVSDQETAAIYDSPYDGRTKLGSVAGSSQGLNVLNSRSDGWSLVEAYRNEDGAFMRGYIKTNKLKLSDVSTTYGIVVDKRSQMLLVYMNGQRVGSCLVCTGVPTVDYLKRETVAGEFKIATRRGTIEYVGRQKGFSRYAIRINNNIYLQEIPTTKRNGSDYSIMESYLGSKQTRGTICVQARASADGGINAEWIWKMTENTRNLKVLVIDDKNRDLIPVGK